VLHRQVPKWDGTRMGKRACDEGNVPIQCRSFFRVGVNGGGVWGLGRDEWRWARWRRDGNGFSMAKVGRGGRERTVNPKPGMRRATSFRYALRVLRTVEYEWYERVRETDLHSEAARWRGIGYDVGDRVADMLVSRVNTREQEEIGELVRWCR